MPPLVFFSFGIPAANNPPNCGAPPTLAVVSDPMSLLLRARFPPGAGGAKPPGGFNIPGTGGAPAIGPPPPSDFLSIMGADRSCVTAFFSFAPFVMSVNRASYGKSVLFLFLYTLNIVPPLSVVLDVPGLLRLTSEELQVESFLAWEAAAAAVLPCRAEEEEVVAAGVEEQAWCRRLEFNQSIL